LTATLAAGPQVDLAWTAATGSIDGYNIYRQVDGGSFTKINAALVAGTSHTDAAPPAGNLCYQVRSQRTGIESAASNTACADNTPPTTPPNAPANLSATLTDAGDPGTTLLAFAFDEGTGQVVTDASGNANHGQRGSTSGTDSADGTWTTGVSGGALQFDGSNDRVVVPDSPTLDPAGSFTIEMWARKNGSSGTLVSKGASGARTFRVRITSRGHVEFLWDRTDGTAQETIAQSAIGNTAWHHIACVYDQAAGQNRIYVDGSLRATGTASGTAATNSASMLVGAHLSGSSRSGYLNGAIDALRIAPAALYAANFTPAAATAPAASLTASLGEPHPTAEHIGLTWQAPSGGTPAAGYNVYRAVNGGPAAQINTALVGVTQYSDLDLVEGELCYTVTAVSALALEGPPSNSDCVTLGTPPPPPPPPPAPGPPQNLSVQLATTPGGPVAGAAAWAFDEGAGDTFADLTGNSHTGQLGSTAGVDTADPLWTSGVGGSGALQFDGSNDRCIVPDALDLRFPGSFTVEAWVKRDVVGATHCVASKGDSQRRNFWVVIDSSNRIDFRWETASGSNKGTTSSTAVTDTNWHHVACVYDQSAGQDRIYLDGALLKSASDTGTPATSADPVYVGARLSGGSLTNWFRGSIDLVRLSPGALYSANFTPATSFGGGPPQTVAQLAWEAPATGTVAGYNVYRQLDGGAFAKVNAALVTPLSWSDVNPPVGALCYQVTAVDAVPQEGAASAPACTGNMATKAARRHPTATAARLEAGPNPFNPTTTIAFAVAAAGHVQLAVYDVRGHRIATLVDAHTEPGEHHVVWNGRDAHGARVASGTYFVTFDSGGTHLRRRLVMLK
jgi:hypothetical protein